MNVISLKKKSLTAVSSVITVVLIAVGLAGYTIFSQEFMKNTAAHQTAILEAVATQLDQHVVTAQRTLVLVAQSVDAEVLANADAAQRLLDREKDARTVFDNGFVLLDSRGTIVAESPAVAGRRGKSLLFRQWVRDTLATGRINVSLSMRLPFPPHDPMVAMTVPVRGRDGSVAGVLIGRQSTTKDNFLASLGRTQVGIDGHLYLFDKERNIIVSSEQELITRNLGNGWNEAFESQGDIVEGIDHENRSGFIGIRGLKSVPWTVGIHYPLEKANAPLYRIQTFLLFATTVVVLLTLITVWIIMRRLTSNLTALTEHVAALPTLHGPERFTAVRTRDEVGMLAAAFNNMIEELDRQRLALDEGREIYRLLANFTSELAILSNPDRSLRYISPNCLALTGYADEEFYNDPDLLERLVHSEDILCWNDHFIGEQSGECLPVDVRLIGREGQIRWFTHSCYPVHDSSGTFIGRRGSFRDITQRVEMERQIEEHKRFIESLLESTSTPLFVLNSRHEVIVWNRACAELTGVCAEDMLGTRNQWKPFYPTERPTLSDLIIDGDLERVGGLYDNFVPADPNTGALRAEGWFGSLGGKQRYVYFDAAPVYSADGKLLAVVETLNDITERKKAEEGHRLFSEAVEQSGSMIIITDTHFVTGYVNRTFCEVTGYTPEEVIGKRPPCCTQTSDMGVLDIEQSLSAGNRWHGEMLNRRRDGSPIWELVTVSPVKDAGGSIMNYLILKEDISELKEAERLLREQQAELTAKHRQLGDLFKEVANGKRGWEVTFDCIDDLVILADRYGTIKLCNRALAAFTEKPFNELKTHHWWELILNDEMEIRHVQETSCELFHRPSGRWFYLNSYETDSEVSSDVVVTLHDLTEVKLVSAELENAYSELKHTHMQLLQQEKMASIGQLAAGVAHEINNPIGFVNSNLNTLAKYMDRLESFMTVLQSAIDTGDGGEVDEARRKLKIDYILGDVRSLITESTEGTDRVRCIVQNLKNFSRSDGENRLSNINECLESTINIAWNEIKYNATVVRDYGDIPQVACFPQQLNQVFLNLLVNASHALEKPGEIGVRTWRQANDVLIAISDTGCGMPPEVLPRIFEPFFTTKDVGKGTGLGLSISYDIIKKHDGDIFVESEVGKGTTFTIRLPIQASAGDGASGSTAPPEEASA